MRYEILFIISACDDSQNARIFNRVYFFDFSKEHFTVQKKYSYYIYFFARLTQKCRTMQFRCNPSRGISKKNMSRVTFIMKPASYTAADLASEKRDSDDFPRSLVCLFIGRIFLGRMHLDGRYRDPQHGRRRFLARRTGSGFYSRERAPWKPTAHSPSDSGRDWLVHVSIPAFQDSARCRRRDSRLRDVPRASMCVSSLFSLSQEREPAEPKPFLAGDEFFANSWINVF